MTSSAAADRRFDPNVDVLELGSPLPPAAVLGALAARGRQWRESLMPPALRAAGYYAVRVRLRGGRFRVWLAYGGRDPLPLVLAGEVRPGPDGGSAVTGALRRGRQVFVFPALVTTIWTVPVFGGTGAPPWPVVLVALGVVWGGTLLAYISSPGAERAVQVAELWAVLRRAAGAHGPDAAARDV